MPDALMIKTDVRKEDSVKEAVASCVAHFGAVHVAIASAGVAPLGMTLTSKTSLDMNVFNFTIDVNLMGSVYLAKYAAV